jgi:hypothetical protein
MTRLSPSPLGGPRGERDATDLMLLRAFARLDSIALGVATGTLCGLTIFAATVVLLLKGGQPVGPMLGLLGQYFIGYTVTASGSVIGLLYGFGAGFGLGWLIASLRNFCVKVYLHVVRLRSQLESVQDVLGPP